MTRLSLVLLLAVTPACSTVADTASDGSGSAETAGETSTEGAGDTSGTAGDGDSTDGTGDGDGDGGDGDGDGDGDGLVTVQNDGFVEGQSVGFQMGFVMGECFASTFTPDAADYPFDLRSAQMLIGGGLGGMENMTVAVYEVDPISGKPTTEIAGQQYVILGADNAFNEADLAALALPAFTMDSFAIAVCHDEHDGSPSIARDGDGTIMPGRNWIFFGGAWYDSSMLSPALAGDWILRAIIEPQP